MELPEVAEFWRGDRRFPAFSAFPRASGAIEVAEYDTAERCGAFATVTGVAAAIAWVEERKREALERRPQYEDEAAIGSAPAEE